VTAFIRPKALLVGGVFDRWTEDKDNYELEEKCLFKVGITAN
jgi:hypothetical protein